MKIDIEKIPPEGLKIDAKEQKEILDVKGAGIEFSEPINISIWVNLTGKTLLINGAVKTNACLICSRCLKEFRQILENSNFNLTLDVTGQKEVDITPDIREEIFILLPVKPLCKRDCKGLCPVCGQDLNEKKCSCNVTKEDIKWRGLGKLKLN